MPPSVFREQKRDRFQRLFCHNRLVYSVLKYGVKYSVRSDTPEVRADELASYIARDLGHGGGHMDKAGGFIQKELLEQKYKYYSLLSKKKNNNHGI